MGKDLHFFLEIGDYRLAYQFGEFSIMDTLDNRQETKRVTEEEALIILRDFLVIHEPGPKFREYFPFWT